MQTPALPVCPHCGQADAVRPVTEVFTGVPGDGPAGAAPVPLAAAIRQQLAPPIAPPQPQKSDFPAAKYHQSSPATTRSFGARIDMALLIGWLVLSFIAFVLVANIDEDLVEY